MNFYDSIFKSIYSIKWEDKSHNIEYDKKNNVFSTITIISILEYINLLSLTMIFKIITKTNPLYIQLSGVLLYFFNYYYFYTSKRHICIISRTPDFTKKNHYRRICVFIYAIFSIVVFLGIIVYGINK